MMRSGDYYVFIVRNCERSNSDICFLKSLGFGIDINPAGESSRGE